MIQVPPTVQICAVTKSHTVAEVTAMLAANPQIQILAENRWPDCEAVFRAFPQYRRHFIGHLQSNKIAKILPLIDCVQSVDSLDLMRKIDHAAQKPLTFTFQINIDADPAKQGINPADLPAIIEQYLAAPPKNLTLIGLMTIGERATTDFAAMRQLFDEINARYFPQNPLPTLSMGMSDDYQQAIAAGSTMVRIGRALFDLTIGI